MRCAGGVHFVAAQRQGGFADVHLSDVYSVVQYLHMRVEYTYVGCISIETYSTVRSRLEQTFLFARSLPSASIDVVR